MPSPPNRGLEEIWKAKQVVPTAFTFIDLFAGIGGLRLGFEAINGKCVFTSEWDKYCNITYRANFPYDDHEIAGDVRPFGENPERIPAFDVLLAGFPCQPFSSAGERKGFLDKRGNVFFSCLEVIEKKQPKYFILTVNGFTYCKIDFNKKRVLDLKLLHTNIMKSNVSY